MSNYEVEAEAYRKLSSIDRMIVDAANRQVDAVERLIAKLLKEEEEKKDK